MGIYKNKYNLYSIKGKYKDEFGNFKDYHRFTGKNGFKKKSDALKYDIEFREKKTVLATQELDRVDITFNQVKEMYYEIARNEIKQSTIDTDREVLTKFSDFNDMMMNRISSTMINKKFQYFDREKEWSLSYIDKCFYVLSKIFKFALSKNIIKVNPMEEVQRIKRPNEFKEEKENYWTESEFEEFIKYVDAPLYFHMFLFLYCTGCRRGEVIAMQWKDIDFNKNTFRVNKTCYQANGGYTLTPPKTKTSNRVRGMGKVLSNELKQWHKKQKRIYGYNDSYFIFGADKPITESTLQRAFNRYKNIGCGWCKKDIIQSEHFEIGSKVKVDGTIYYLETGLGGAKKFEGDVIIKNIVDNKNGINYELEMPFKDITIHGLRHSHVSMLTNGGAQIQDVAYRIGDTMEQVQKTYSHFFPPREKEILDIVDRINIKK